MSFEGADPAQLDGLAGQFDQLAGDLDGRRVWLSGWIEVDRFWRGNRASEFRHQWEHEYAPQIVQAAQFLRAGVRSLHDNANQQRVASGETPRNYGGGFLQQLFGAPGAGIAALSGLPLLAELRRLHGVGWIGAVTAGRSTSGAGAAQAALLDWSRSGSGHLGAVPVSGSASAFVGAQAHWQGETSLSLKDGANAAIAAGAMVGLRATAGGRLGNDTASLSGKADAFAGAEAEGKASAHLGLDGARAHAEVGAFAGAKADASATAHVPGAEASAGIEGEAGIGAHAQVDASVSASDIKASVDVGAAIGLGGGVKFSVDIKPDEVLHLLPKWPW